MRNKRPPLRKKQHIFLFFLKKRNKQAGFKVTVHLCLHIRGRAEYKGSLLPRGSRHEAFPRLNSRLERRFLQLSLSVSQTGWRYLCFSVSLRTLGL